MMPGQGSRGERVKPSHQPTGSFAANAGRDFSTPMEMEREGQLSAAAVPVASPRKRPVPPITGPDVDADADELDVMGLLPGSKIVKRRKIAEEEERARRGEAAPPKGPAGSTTVQQAAKVEKVEKVEATKDAKGKGKGKKETSFEAQARQFREQDAAEAERARADEKARMDGIDIEGLRNLAIVEPMKVGPRAHRPIRDAYGDESAHWKAEWNGRNNFKRFRRAGRGSSTRSVTGPRVFVDLVEAKGRDYGIGDGMRLAACSPLHPPPRI